MVRRVLAINPSFAVRGKETQGFQVSGPVTQVPNHFRHNLNLSVEVNLVDTSYMNAAYIPGTYQSQYFI